MDFIPLLKTRKNALSDCQNTEDLSLERRQKIQQNLKILNYSPWVTKGTLLFAIVFGINWKKEVPFARRELPLAIGAIALSALSDYMVNEYVWKQHESEVTKLTGFKNGFYVSPERMKKMRSSMSKGRNVMSKDQFQAQDDEQLQNLNK